MINTIYYKTLTTNYNLNGAFKMFTYTLKNKNNPYTHYVSLRAANKIHLKNMVTDIFTDRASKLVTTLKTNNWNDLITKIRNKLYSLEMKNVKIIVSSGVDLNKIKEFESLNTPVDIYGIGSPLIARRCQSAADLIKIQDKYESKFGSNISFEKTFKKFNK